MEQLRDLIKENYISNEQDDSDLFEGNNNNEINSPVNDINIEENEEKIKTENDLIFYSIFQLVIHFYMLDILKLCFLLCILYPILLNIFHDILFDIYNTYKDFHFL